MSSHRAAFDICDALITADNGASGLNNTASPAHLFGGFARVGDTQQTRTLPRIEMEVAGEREEDAMPNQRVDLIIRFHIWTDVNTAFRTTEVAGTQDTVAARHRTVFHRVTGATSNGWIPNMFARIGGQQAPSSGTKAHLVETYALRMSRTS